MKYLILTALLAVGIGGFTAANGQEKQLQRKDLPPAVAKTADRESAGFTLLGFSTERENGARTYEVELSVNGRTKDVTMDANGNVIEVEEQVSMESLPASVQSALKARAGTGTITKIESITKAGKLVAYEAIVTTGKKHREVQVGPNGEKLAKEQ